MSKESDIQQVSEPVWKLARAFQKFMGEYVNGFPEKVSEQIVPLSNQISQVERRQEQSLFDLESVKQQLEQLASVNKLLENASKANQLLGSEHYIQHVVEPMVRSLFPIFDLISDFRKHHSDSAGIEMGLSDSVYSQLQQFIANFDIEIIEHATGESFDSKTMKPLKWEHTSDKDLEKLVSRSLQPCFRLGQTRILRMETVSLFKYQASKTNSINLSERIEE